MASPTAGAKTFRAADNFNAGENDGFQDSGVRGDGGAGRCCHATWEKLRLGFFDPISGNTDAVPELPSPAMMLAGFAWIGLAAYVRAIRNRAATVA